MAKRSQEKQALIDRLEASRQNLTAHADRLRHRLDVPARIGQSIKHFPIRWLGAFTGAGFAASLFAKRPRTKRKKRSRLIGLIGTASIAFLKPRLTRLAITAIRDRLTQPTRPQQPQIPQAPSPGNTTFPHKM